MINSVLDLSDRPARLTVRNSLLLLRFPGAEADRPAVEKVYRCEHLGKPNEVTIPLADIAVLIVSHPQVSFTHAVLSGLASAGGVLVACNEKHMPVSMLLPLASHSLQTERFAAQASMALPAKKRAWQQIVRAKIRSQAQLISERNGDDHELAALAARVRSGDPANVEAQAARIYWRELFSGRGFRRDPDSGGVNACLNYGYAVLRAAVARAICGAGLHPSLGLHHHNRYDAFCLADDLMEPFRPVVDREVARLAEGPGKDFPLDSESRRAILSALLGRFTAGGESRTLFDWASRVASSLVSVIENREEVLQIPLIRPSVSESPDDNF
jgi:CRISPR-associated protein Cas1